MVRSLHLSLFLLLMSLSAAAQVSLEHTQGYYTFGLNAGWSCQSSDVRAAKGGYGLGLTLGRNIFYSPGAPLSFDLRGRFLFARQYGLNPYRTYDIQKNTAINGSRPGGLNYFDYPILLGENRGFAFLNYRTDEAELALEGVLTLNRLRERTRWIVSLYGGIGIDWYRARIDQALADGTPYYEGYSSIKDNTSESSARTELRQDVLDGHYETLADGFDSKAGKLGFMPSLGIELGYQLTPRFSLHLGHRVTFSRVNTLDGQQWADTKNDFYHYTSLGMQWIIEPAKPRTQGPIIDITYPNINPYTTNNPSEGSVRANIRNVKSPVDVTCEVNGRPNRFDFGNERFVTDFNLQRGRNEILITARNEAGSDRKLVVIILEGSYVPPPPPPPIVERPIVNFSQPSYPDYRTDNPDFTVRATVSNVTNKSDITFRVNDSDRNFTFDSRTGELRSDINLREGDNRVRIEARNAAGYDDAATNIIYQRRDTRPYVDITDPDRQDTQVSQPSVRVRATVRNVTRREDITFRLNNRENRSFTFDASRELLQADITLDAGSNRIEIIAENRAGSGSDEVRITYRPADIPKGPHVQITRPDQANSSTVKSTATVEAVTENVGNRSDITFTVNGRNINAFNFNSGNGRLSADVALDKGNNDVVIRVRNRDGSDEASVVIRRIEGDIDLPQPPKITITQPADNSETSNRNAELKATITHVDNKNNITLTFNGRRINAFEYSNGNLRANLSLEDGNNTIRVQATNNDGNDDKTVNVRYRAAQPPQVNIVQPTNNAISSKETVDFKAQTQRVNSKSEISLYLNGKTVSNFDFSTSRQEITAAIRLQPGSNTIRVKVQNQDGSNEAQVSVNYSPPKPPEVSIVAPSNNSNTDKETIDFKARTQNVGSKSEISLFLNGKTVSNFDFSTGKQEVTASIRLQAGSNTIRIKVQNQDGSNEAQVSVSYNPPKAPGITITDPTTATTTSEARYTVKATTQNVGSRSELTIAINGKNTTNFTFSNGKVEIPADLAVGDNTIRIKAQNQGGSDEKTARITRRQPQLPFVTIQSPANNSKVSTADVTVKATITNVSDPKAVQFALDGKSFTTFTLNKENFEGQLTGLKAGKHTVRISASNDDGRHEAAISFTYEPAPTQAKPTVKITQPVKPNTVSQQSNYTLVATVENVASASDVKILVNKKTISGFSYDAKTQKVEAAITLAKGTNSIIVQAENEAGKAEASTTLTYQPSIKRAPVVEITSVSQPVTNPFYPNVGKSTILATIKNVTQKDQIALLVNGQQVTDFTFDVKTGKFEATVDLNRGENTIVIRARNDDGGDEEQRTINF